MLSKKQRIVKRMFDVVFSIIGIIIFFIPILILICIATLSTKKNGLFSQQRVGQHAKLFTMYKIRSMRFLDDKKSNILPDTSRITPFGKFLRKYKLDELPQLFNVLMGTMSFVGPRPDVVGYADKLIGDDRIILTVKPGITGPATLKYRNEEAILAAQKDPVAYNNEVIWKDKITINKRYVQDWSFFEDLKSIFKTIFN